MRTMIAVLVAVLGLTFAGHSADTPTGNVDFKNAPLDRVLAIYQELSGAQLVQSSQVKKMQAGITVRSSSPLSKAETLKLLEKALVEQAGVVITPLEGEKVSVTFNDALPIRPAKD